MSILVLRFVDRYVFGALVILLSPLKFFHGVRGKEVMRKPKKVLVIRLWALGSSLLTFPMVKRLRDRYGEGTEYHLLASTRNIGVFKNQGYFSKTFNLFNPKDLFALVLRPKSYDVVIDVEEYFRISSLMALWCGKFSSGYSNIRVRSFAYSFPVKFEEHRHSVRNCLALAEMFGVPQSAPDSLEKLRYSEQDAERAESFLAQYPEGIRVAFHAGGAETAPERFWSDAHWVRLTETFVEEYGEKAMVFFTGTDFEKEAVDRIFASLSENAKSRCVNACGKLPLFAFARFLEMMDAMVSNDTGPMHLSAAMGTRTVGLFWPELPERFGPYPPERNAALYEGDGNASILVFLGKYVAPKEKFVDRIKPESVMEKLREFLA